MLLTAPSSIEAWNADDGIDADEATKATSDISPS
jgi:hypothetical protein